MSPHLEPFTGKVWQVAIIESSRLRLPVRFRTKAGAVSSWNTGDSLGTQVPPYIQSNGRNMVNPDWIDAPFEWALSENGLAITQLNAEHHL